MTMFMNTRNQLQMEDGSSAAQETPSAPGASASGPIIFVVIAPSSSVSLNQLPSIKHSNTWLARATGVAAPA